MIRLRALLCLLTGLVLGAPLAVPVAATEPPYQTDVLHWGANTGGFSSWALMGLVLDAEGRLRLDPVSAASDMASYPAGSYAGEAVSPALPTRFGFTEAIASWNADTPPGSWLETRVRAQIGDRWTKWYSLGVWAADPTTVARHSVRDQGDADGTVAVDTLVLNRWQVPATAVQVAVRLFATAEALPSLRAVALTYSTTPTRPAALAPGDPSRWNQILSVPECSQMVYPDGGEVWCSPTSTAMVLAYWQGAASPCAPGVRAAVSGVYDWSYGGHGNWPFNTAYAATQGLEGYVVRFASLADAEPWIAAGVPVIISIAWQPGELTGAPIASTSGHLAVLAGFDANGDPVVNDPAAATDWAVQRTYRRAELEALWLARSGGTAYLIYPLGHPVPGFN